MKCPNCATIMEQVKAPSTNVGLFVILEQCPGCGGLWFDRYEMAQISYTEALNIDNVDDRILYKATDAKEKLNCPKDGEPLMRLRDINIPEETDISRCHLCEGVWMNCGEFKKYKEHVAERQADNEEYLQKHPLFQEETEAQKAAVKRKSNAILNNIASQLLPMPQSFARPTFETDEEQPFILSEAGVELLQKMPQEEKIKIYQLMAQEHDEEIESEKRFIRATVNILNIIMRLLTL